MINYVLREKDSLGFPPADDEMLLLMRMHPSKDQEEILTASPKKSPTKTYPKRRMDITWYHSLAVGVLQASFEILSTWVEKQFTGMSLNNLAALRYKETAHNSESKELLNHRPRQRIEFCQSVATRAEEIAGDLIRKSS